MTQAQENVTNPRQQRLPFEEGHMYSPANDLREVAHTRSGRNVDPLKGLKTYLIEARHAIGHDSQHIKEETLSDIFAFEQMITASLESYSQDSTDPALAATKSFISSGCAMYLIGSLYLQRAEKKRGYKAALKIWADYEKECQDPNISSDQKKRRFIAKERLTEKMRLSGLQYESLPDKTENFDPEIFKQDATDYGFMGDKKSVWSRDELMGRYNRTRNFLRQTQQDPLHVGMDVWSDAWLLVGKGAKDLLVFGGNALINFADCMGKPQPLAKAFQMTSTSRRNDLARAEKQNDLKQKPINELTLDDLTAVTQTSFEELSKGLNDDEKAYIREILSDLNDIKKAKTRTKVALIVQSVFQAMQIAEGIPRVINGDGDYLKNAYTFAMASGPWKGFAVEYLRLCEAENAKRGLKGRELGKVFGVDVETGSRKKEPAPAPTEQAIEPT